MRLFTSDGRLLAEECEAFLEGRIAELCADRGDPVPVWAWLNLLAHGTAEEVGAVVLRDRHADRWRQARAYVAGELLDHVEAAGEELLAFQQRVLVPLELDVVACPAAARWTPGQMFGALLRTLPAARRPEADLRSP